MRGEIPEIITPIKKIPIWEGNEFPWRTSEQRIKDYRNSDNDRTKAMFTPEELNNFIMELHEARMKSVEQFKDGEVTPLYYILFGMCVASEYIQDSYTYKDLHIKPIMLTDIPLKIPICKSCERPMEKDEGGNRYFWRCPECGARGYDLTGGPNPID